MILRFLAISGRVFLLLAGGALLGAVVYLTGIPGLLTPTGELGARKYNLQTQINLLRRENNSLEVMRNKKEEISTRIEALQEQIAMMRKIVPDDAGTDSLTKTLSQLASASAVRLKSLVPTEPVGHEFYTAIPFIVKVEGSFPALENFYRKLTTQERLINVPALTLEPTLSNGSRSIRPNLPATETCVVNAYFSQGRAN